MADDLKNTLQRIIQSYGTKLKDDIITQIKRDNFVRSGFLLRSVQVNYANVQDDIVLELSIADHYQYLKTGKKAKLAKTKGLSSATATSYLKKLSNSDRVVLNILGQNNFVGDIVRRGLPMVEKELTQRLNEDVERIFNLKIKDRTFKV